MTEELKPCPFCGDDEELRVCQPPHLSDYWVVHCGCCGGEMQDGSKGGAIAGWNERTPPSRNFGPGCGTRPTDEAVIEKVWQPIETAPRDGDDILVLFSDHGAGCLVVSWNDEPKQPGWQWDTLDGLSYHRNAFSHWMPLPESPALEAARKQG